MGPVGAALTFVGLWLVVGLGVFFAAAGARGAFASGVGGTEAGQAVPGQASAAASAPLDNRGLSFALMALGVVCTLGGLAALVASFVVH